MECCALQDKVDDVVVGVKSTALLFGDNTKAWLSTFAASQMALLVMTGVNHAGVPCQSIQNCWPLVENCLNMLL
jgi:4-hydroxybenzoate polyprenyltransferase